MNIHAIKSTRWSGSSTVELLGQVNPVVVAAVVDVDAAVVVVIFGVMAISVVGPVVAVVFDGICSYVS